MELHKIIYDLLLSQIKFGTYKFKDPLPKMDDISQWFSVSLDTVKAAYHQLKKEGYITLTKKAGAAVAIQFEEAEIDRNIQTFFSPRKDAVIDLCQSFTPLFSHVLWYGMKNAGTVQLDELERLCSQQKILRPYIIVQRIHLIYGSLKNDLVLRLIWQAFLFCQAPFMSLPANIVDLKDYNIPLLDMINLCRKKDWDGLWKTVTYSQAHITSAIQWFYQYYITPSKNEVPVSFHWNAYQNSSQRCYSLGIDILKGIRLGIFAQDGFLPPPAKIAEYMQVSAITVRRTIKMLNQLGVTQSINGVGTKILSVEHSMENCDFNQPLIQKRLLNFAQSLQILAMTCAACMKSVLTNPSAVDMWKKRLAYTKENFRYESVVYASVEIIPRYTQNQTMQQIYEHLVCFLLWGYPLRSMHGSREEINKFYLPYLNFFLEKLDSCDWDGLTDVLENLLFYELQFAVTRLDELGVKNVTSLLFPGLNVSPAPPEH
ncbi:GntR family transcriptional regulator [Lactonifactor sp. BIOML-A3]|uniref:GntR family transcriptional regulator n=1 Tax=unclassified Lactonifactor TaxID=2636670 RepID=UPI0012AFB023|nr:MULTISPECIES: GntR family transcriptional regulator [unclassified Lactonifactor]MSA01521.1 GntR family transcriptional regulator [Lactonifactor sp. BIOML-A5]MSA08163.1 GntR family transcriptional regulator [Lactonifactor sp. BIOML-A4]MSA12428.1 GntR family transcriptional regulator [Lactonifactor sp. BIOML-A3]MSA17005.1 GntR family transcriptional regulator [Lactonifactor sp. BIOML-A2]MSA37782.1 GntR family transcriptional regulator [Lactonifactor sp. BIOML-A1]